MDRRLLTFAIIAFTLELALFLGDVGLLPLRWLSRSTSNVERTTIGEVQIARQNVRRRGFDSNIWEDSVTKDQLFENDSILTLSGSTAKLKLQGDVNIELHENTLVVLEPMSTDVDKPFRLKFSRGDLRAQNPKRGVTMKSGDWSITATPGADLSLRAVDSGRVEVEVSSGQVDVQHAVHGLHRKIGSEQRVTLFPEDASPVVSSSVKLKWDQPDEQKIYAHTFPILAHFTWQGSAKTLQMLSPTQGTKTFNLKNQQVATDLEFVPGSYHLTLHDDEEVSRTLSVQVLKAPKMVHLTPLPRDRVKTNDLTLFAWLSEILDGHYLLEFARDAQFKEVVHSHRFNEPRGKTAIPLSGSLFWRVTGFDEENFLIPAGYSYPIFSDPDPLAPPKMRAPTAVEDEDEAANQLVPRSNFAWHWLWSLLLPKAEGQNKKVKATKKKAPIPPVIFNWEALPGADYYIIEISQSMNFEQPEVIAKLSTNFYAWTKFDKQIYYYRVAGGANSGRMGVFSAPEKIDLTIWPLPKTAKTKVIVKTESKAEALNVVGAALPKKVKQPVVEEPLPSGPKIPEPTKAAELPDINQQPSALLGLLNAAPEKLELPGERTEKPAPLVLSNDELKPLPPARAGMIRSPMPISNDPLVTSRPQKISRGDFAEEEKKPAIKQVINAPPPIEPKIKTSGQSHGAIWWRGIYQAEKQSAPNNVKADLTGGSFIGLGFHLDMDLDTSYLVVSGNFQSLDWKPSSKSKWPFQSKVTTNFWHLNVGFSEPNQNLYYGGTVQQVSRLHRADLEKLEAKSHAGFGPMVGWRNRQQTYTQNHELNLAIGDGFTQLTSQNMLQYEIDYGFFVGLELNLSTSFGSYKSTYGQFGVQAGYAW